ncbi:MAG TPA: glycosyltransferase, partial [Fimbriimonas sp.]|nr:glycosyltransferase [Fimbriimonas sp.]
IPLPTSMDDHQLFNAHELEYLGGAEVCLQSQTTPESLAAVLSGWLEDEKRRDEAASALSKWDVPDATYRIWSAVKGVVQSSGHAKT